MSLLVLLHSPLVGPSTWSPVAERLRSAGRQVVVPSLLAVGEGGPPYWPRVVEAVSAGLAGTDPGEPLVLVAHSNAGLFVPVLTRDLGRQVAGVVFADATIPGSAGSQPVVEDGLLPFLRGRVGPDRRLPRWTEWWGEQETAGMFPDRRTRQLLTAEQPRLPLAYFLDHVPLPGGWADRTCSYLRFSPGCAPEAEKARRLGWPSLEISGDHLHQVVDPDAVARALIDLTETTAVR